MDIEPIKTCEVCEKECSFEIECEHPKNGYCLKFLMQAKIDAQNVNMHDSIHIKAKNNERTN